MQEEATNCIHYSCSRTAPIACSSCTPRCERHPTIVYEMIIVARYEVVGSCKAICHLDWLVGSYKRREARAYDAIMRCGTPHHRNISSSHNRNVATSVRRVDAGSWVSFVGYCESVVKLFPFITMFLLPCYPCQW